MANPVAMMGHMAGRSASPPQQMSPQQFLQQQAAFHPQLQMQAQLQGQPGQPQFPAQYHQPGMGGVSYPPGAFGGVTAAPASFGGMPQAQVSAAGLPTFPGMHEETNSNRLLFFNKSRLLNFVCFALILSFIARTVAFYYLHFFCLFPLISRLSPLPRIMIARV